MKMTGRLRLDRLSKMIESFLATAASTGIDKDGSSVHTGRRKSHGTQGNNDRKESTEDNSRGAEELASHTSLDRVLVEQDCSGQLYFHPPTPHGATIGVDIQEEIQSAVPLSHVLAGSGMNNENSPAFASELSLVSNTDRMHTPNQPSIINSPSVRQHQSGPQDGRDPYVNDNLVNYLGNQQSNGEPSSDRGKKSRRNRPLVNREATVFDGANSNSDNDGHEHIVDAPPDNMADSNPARPTNVRTANGMANTSRSGNGAIPVIPLEEIMLIDALSNGRVTTVYKAMWTHGPGGTLATETVSEGTVVALKVAMVSASDPRDTSDIDEVRQEADIAAMLEHPNICDIVGVAADAE